MPEDAVERYPWGIDVEWVAIDGRGRVGVFTTAGMGPIPSAYLDAPGALDLCFDAIRALPERTESILFAQVPRPDDFVAFARRGCFSFDWEDGRYELQARPQAPMTFDAAEWPEVLRPILLRATSPSLDFEQGQTADVTALGCERAR